MTDELPSLSFTARVEGVFVVETEAVESTRNRRSSSPMPASSATGTRG